MADEKKESVESTDSSKNEETIEVDPSTKVKLDDGKSAPTDGGETKSDKDEEKKPEVDFKAQYEEAEKQIGKQGKELGDYRGFFKEISPLLDKLQGHPELVEAIMQGKMDTKTVETVLAGEATVKEATNVAEAHDEIKKKLGAKKYKETPSEDIEKMVAEKAQEIVDKATADIKKGITQSDERRAFESKVNDFVKNTPDFPEYADGVRKWFEEHPNQFEIDVAYDAVKGRVLAEKAGAEEEAKKAEAAKGLAANAGPGGSQGAKIVEDKDVADQLIGEKSNPNVL